MTKRDLEPLFGISGLAEQLGIKGEVDPSQIVEPEKGTSSIDYVKDAIGPDPVFAIDEDGTQRNPFARDSALLQTVEGALEDANRARIEAASEVLGFEYIP